MRLSIKEGDAGYQFPSRTRYASITLNGVKVSRVITADEELGYILRYATDDEGRIVIDRTSGQGVAVTEELHGAVQVVNPPL